MKSLYKAHTGIFLPLAKSGSKVFVTRKFAVDSNQFLRLKKRIKSITWGCTVSKFLRSGLCKIFAKCYPNFPSYWLHLPRNFLKVWPEMKDVQCFLQVKGPDLSKNSPSELPYLSFPGTFRDNQHLKCAYRHS